MKDITEILCKAFDVDEDQVLGAFDTEHEPVECNEAEFEDDVLVQKDHDGNVVIGYVVHDPESADYWNDSDGNGELHTFRSESERDAFVEERKAEGQVPLVVDHYKHGNEHYSVANTHNYPDRQFDVAPRCVYVPPQEIVDHYRKETNDDAAFMAALTENANVVLNEYSDCVNGEVYGGITETWSYDEERNGFHMIEEDAVWRYIGFDHAVNALREDMPNPPETESPRP